MDEKNTLKTYIQTELANGSTTETIVQQLVDNGWNAATVDAALREVTAQANAHPVSNLMGSAQANLTPAVEDYGVFDAIKDAVAALRTNAIGVLSAMTIGFVVNVVAVVVGVVIGLGAMFAAIASSVGNSSQPFGILAGLFVVYLIVFSLISAFTQALIGLTINDGAEGRTSQVKAVVGTALRRTLRVLAATVLCSLIAAGPALLAILLAFFLAAAAPGLAVVAYVLAFLAIIIGPLIALRLLLMPVVALFETEVPLTGLFGRTQYLMKGGGVYFIVKFLLVVLVAAIVLSMVLPSEKELENASVFTSLASGAVGAAVGTLYSAVLVVFYRNRRAVKG